MSAKSIALTFPGQGSQYIGMGQELAQSRSQAAQVFEEIDDALDFSLSKLIFSGEEETLKLTENAQPALMAVSMAIMKTLEHDGFSIKDSVFCVAGHSLGEYSALCAAGVFSISDTAKLLRLRGQAMQRAVPVGEGAMAAIIGMDIEAVTTMVAELASETNIVSVANDNANGQVVISGEKVAVEAAATLSKEKGAKMAVLLPVSAPFHCQLMLPAAEEMKDALDDATMHSPIVPLMANITAELTLSPDDIRQLLVEQITGVVRWRQSVINMSSMGVDTLLEVGAGKVLSGLAKRIDRSIATKNIESLASMEQFINPK
jgi:[acyl-carrier-protein] S-malonyltransferase